MHILCLLLWCRIVKGSICSGCSKDNIYIPISALSRYKRLDSLFQWKIALVKWLENKHAQEVKADCRLTLVTRIYNRLTKMNPTQHLSQSHINHISLFQNQINNPSTFPPLTTIQTQNKNRHWLICTPRLFLRTCSLGTLTPPTRKQACIL